jgi:putative addiction module component (TIGR02574 family)
MKADLEQIEAQARGLSDNDRARLAESMIESLHESLAGVESAWVEEIERRVEAFDRGELPSYPAEDVFDEGSRLVEDLWDSIASDQNALPLTTEQRAELDRRLDAYELDRDPGRPAEDVIAEIRRKL